MHANVIAAAITGACQIVVALIQTTGQPKPRPMRALQASTTDQKGGASPGPKPRRGSP